MNIDALRKLFSYDAETGVITRTYNGKIFGSRHGAKRPYLRGLVEGKMVYAHRLAFMLFHGIVPSFVDHIDGDVTNNRITNLRECTQAENSRNQRKREIETSSVFKGVYFDKRTKRWHADIKLNRKKISLGTFKGEQAAAEAYNRAAGTYHAEFARLNDV